VEQYERIELASVPSTEVAGRVEGARLGDGAGRREQGAYVVPVVGNAFRHLAHHRAALEMGLGGTSVDVPRVEGDEAATGVEDIGGRRACRCGVANRVGEHRRHPVVAGERDTFTPAFLARAMAEVIPKGELLMVTEGTHVTPIEQPDLVNARIETFLHDRVL